MMKRLTITLAAVLLCGICQQQVQANAKTSILGGYAQQRSRRAAVRRTCWTPWFDRDDPSATGDLETLTNLRAENPGKICSSPLQIQVQTTSGASVNSTGNFIFKSDTITGFVCRNKDQTKGLCQDYRVRFRCPRSFCVPRPTCWTPWFDRDDPSATGDWETLADLRKKHKICSSPLKIQVQTTSGASVNSTGNVIYKSDTKTGFVCRNKDQTKGSCQDYRVRFQCFCVPRPTCWTPWFDRDDPSATGDWETLADLRKKHKICSSPLKIQAQTTSGASVNSTGNVIYKSDTTTGFVCRNKDQIRGSCKDYRVRFQCPCVNIYNKCWTQWFDRDNPSATGDWETLTNLRAENPGKICNKPLQIQAQTTSGADAATTGDTILVSDTTMGFVCQNKDQTKGKSCKDYRVRFQCPRSFCAAGPRCWTAWFDRDNPSGSGDWETLFHLRGENPGKICSSPLQIQAQTTSGVCASSTGNIISVFDTTHGFICKNSDQTGTKCKDYRVRFQCPLKFCTESLCWTKWYDIDNPSGVGDWELLKDIRKRDPKGICRRPLHIDVVTTDTKTPFTSTGQKHHVYSPTHGFACRNQDQGGGRCRDYKVRFGCPCGCFGAKP